MNIKAIATLVFVCSFGTAYPQVILEERFDRADGPVGYPWTSWHAGSLPGDSETRIENGRLRAPGAYHQEGGIFRDDLDLNPPIYISFEFSTDRVSSAGEPNDGGFDLRSQGEIEPPNVPADAHSYFSPARFMMFSGVREVSRLTAQGGTVFIDTLQPQFGQRDFGTWNSRIVVFIDHDYSSTLTIYYQDGKVPESVSFAFPPPLQTLFIGKRFAISNSNQSYGPHYFDNIVVSRSPIPDPTIRGQAILAGFARSTFDIPFEYELIQSGSVVTKSSGRLDNQGRFAIAPGVSGPAELRLRYRTGLWQRVAFDATPEGIQDLYLLLPNGDCNGDNNIGTDDYLILNAAFDKALGQSSFDVRADLNGDDYVGTDDYLILNKNFDLTGD